MEELDYLRFSAKDVVGHARKVTFVNWNNEGKHFSVVSQDNNVRIGQLEASGTTKNVHTIPLTSGGATTCWNPAVDNRLAICSDDKTIDLWDVRASRAGMKIGTQGNNSCCSWSRCGNYIASVNRSDLVSVIDVREGRVVKKKRFPYQVNEVLFSANPDYLVASTGGEGTGAIDIISIGSDEISAVDSLAAHGAICCGLSIDQQYSRVAVGSLDYTFSIWDLDNLVCKHTKSMETAISGMSFSGSGQQLAVFSDDPYILICDSDTGEGLCKVPMRSTINWIAWHPKLPLIAVALNSSSVSQFLQFISILPASSGPAL